MPSAVVRDYERDSVLACRLVCDSLQVEPGAVLNTVVRDYEHDSVVACRFVCDALQAEPNACRALLFTRSSLDGFGTRRADDTVCAVDGKDSG